MLQPPPREVDVPAFALLECLRAKKPGTIAKSSQAALKLLGLDGRKVSTSDAAA